MCRRTQLRSLTGADGRNARRARNLRCERIFVASATPFLRPIPGHESRVRVVEGILRTVTASCSGSAGVRSRWARDSGLSTLARWASNASCVRPQGSRVDAPEWRRVVGVRRAEQAGWRVERASPLETVSDEVEPRRRAGQPACEAPARVTGAPWSRISAVPRIPRAAAHRSPVASDGCQSSSARRDPGNSSTDQPQRPLGVGQPRQPAAPRPAAANGLGAQSGPVEHRQADDAVTRGAAIAKCRYRRRDSDPLR